MTGRKKPEIEIPFDWDGFHRKCKHLLEMGDDYYKCLKKALEEVDIIDGKSCVQCPEDCHNYQERGR